MYPNFSEVLQFSSLLCFAAKERFPVDRVQIMLTSGEAPEIPIRDHLIRDLTCKTEISCEVANYNDATSYGESILTVNNGQCEGLARAQLVGLCFISFFSNKKPLIRCFKIIHILYARVFFNHDSQLQNLVELSPWSTDKDIAVETE